MRKIKKPNQLKTNVIAFRVKTRLKDQATELVHAHEIDGLGSLSEAGVKLFEAWVDGRLEYKNHRFEAKEK